jgi:hypothetical protein
MRTGPLNPKRLVTIGWKVRVFYAEDQSRIRREFAYLSRYPAHERGEALTADSTKLDVLRRILAEGHGDRRSFLLRALGLGISIPAAYAVLGLIVGNGRAEAACPADADLEALDRQLAAHPAGKVVAPGEAAIGDDTPGGVEARIERLRRRYAGERHALRDRPPGSSRPPDLRLSQDEWGNWNNWENWNNWDNWQDWNNWGNGGD